MSAPDTNIEKQEKRHRPALLGIKGALGFGVLMMLMLLVFNGVNRGDGAAVTNTAQAGEDATVAATDVYAPGTNKTSTPVASD